MSTESQRGAVLTVGPREVWRLHRRVLRGATSASVMLSSELAPGQ